jgi:predicted amidophosphoribosyltransferase
MKQPRLPTTQVLARDSSRLGRLRPGEEDRTKIITVKTCRACTAGLFDDDNFCRWCGAPQYGDLTVSRRSHISLTSLYQIAPSDQMRPISTYHTVSGPLVRAITENMSASLTAQSRQRYVQTVIQALVSIPIWLVFVLLSPFDAYLAAKNITKGV